MKLPSLLHHLRRSLHDSSESIGQGGGWKPCPKDGDCVKSPKIMVVATFRLRFWRFLAGIKLAATNVHGFSHSLDPTDRKLTRNNRVINAKLLQD